MPMRRRRFLACEDFQGHVAAICFQSVVQFPDAVCLEPAALARGDQNRAFDISSNPADRRAPDDIRIEWRDATSQERPLMQIPDAAVATRGREKIVKGD